MEHFTISELMDFIRAGRPEMVDDPNAVNDFLYSRTPLELLMLAKESQVIEKAAIGKKAFIRERSEKNHLELEMRVRELELIIGNTQADNREWYQVAKIALQQELHDKNDKIIRRFSIAMILIAIAGILDPLYRLFFQ